MIEATREEQQRLYELQQVDLGVRQLQHRRRNLPEQRALDEHNQTLSLVTAEYATSKERLDALSGEQRRLEREVAAVDARRRSEEGRMYSGRITSERELTALRGELGSLRTRKSSLEDRLLEVMEETEDLESAVAALGERHAELSGQIKRLAADRDEAATDIDADLDRRQAERTAIAADVRPDVLAYYDGLRARKDGVAVARLERRTCQGCRLELTAIELEEVHERARRGLARCEQCGRILVLDS